MSRYRSNYIIELSDNMTDNQLPQLIPIMFPELIRIFKDEKVIFFYIRL